MIFPVALQAYRPSIPYIRAEILNHYLDPDQQIRGHLEHDPEKWTPVFRKDHAQTKR
jgi:hypothetical protein